MYCNVYYEYRKSKKTKISDIFEKTLSLAIDYSYCGHEHQKISKEEEWTEILKFLGLFNNIE